MKLFKSVPNAFVGRSVHDLSYSKMFDADMGILYPVMCDEVVPGDYFKIGGELVARMLPLTAPILHRIDVKVEYFFVPYRLLDANWETIITGGVNGDDATPLPRWVHGAPGYGKGTLWDFLGYQPSNVGLPLDAFPLDYPRRAYNFIWNEYYRDENLQAKKDFLQLGEDALLNCAWEKDYFTSCLPWMQRGTAGALPIAGLAPVIKTDGNDGSVLGAQTDHVSNLLYIVTSDFDGKLSADLSGVAQFDVNDLRLAFQTQKWMERNARCGVRYTEFLRGHFGVSPTDARLDRPEFIGGLKSPLVISEVLQTSETDTTPQGNLAGHGITVHEEYCGSYRVEEFGLIMGLLRIVPKPAYQNGINRQWLRRSRLEFYFPEFSTLSEQAVEKAELYITDNATQNREVFGYQGRFDEMRYKPNMVHGNMRDTFQYWHLARAITNPVLNEDFIKCVPRKNIFAVETDPGFIIQYGNRIKAVRPIPVIAEPGLIDHH